MKVEVNTKVYSFCLNDFFRSFRSLMLHGFVNKQTCARVASPPIRLLTCSQFSRPNIPVHIKKGILLHKTLVAMRFPAKITSSCIWVAITVDLVILHWYACGADRQSVGQTWGRPAPIQSSSLIGQLARKIELFFIERSSYMH